MTISILIRPISITADLGRCSRPCIHWFVLVLTGRILLSRIIEINTGRITGHCDDQSHKAGVIDMEDRKRGKVIAISMVVRTCSRCFPPR